MKKELENAVKHIAEKAASCKDQDEALKYTQAALNAAHALTTIHNIKAYQPPENEQTRKLTEGEFLLSTMPFPGAFRTTEYKEWWERYEKWKEGQK